MKVQCAGVKGNADIENMHQKLKHEKKNMLLETRRLIIRSLHTSDEKAFIEMASDGSLTEIYGDCSECYKWMGEFISDAIKLEKEDDPFHEYLAFAIEDKTDHRVIGSVGSSYYEDFGEVGVTYFIGAGYRGNGYAAEALQCFTDYMFARYSLKKLIATASVRNAASCKTLERAGFSLVETRMYRDLYDEDENMSNIYELGEREARDAKTRCKDAEMERETMEADQ